MANHSAMPGRVEGLARVLLSDMAVVASLVAGLSNELEAVHAAAVSAESRCLRAEMKQAMLQDQQAGEKFRSSTAGMHGAGRDSAAVADHISHAFVDMHAALHHERRLRQGAEAKQVIGSCCTVPTWSSEMAQGNVFGQAMLQDQKSSSAFRSGMSSSLAEPDPMRSIDFSQERSGPGSTDASSLSPVPATDASAPRGASRRPECEIDSRRDMHLSDLSTEQPSKDFLAPERQPVSSSERREEPEHISLASARGAADEPVHQEHESQEKATMEILQSRIEEMKLDIKRHECQLGEAKASYMRSCAARTIQALLRRKGDRMAFLEVRLRLRRYLARQTRQNRK